MGIITNNFDPDLQAKMKKVELDVRAEYAKKLENASFWKRPVVEWKMHREIKRRQQLLQSDYCV